MIATIYLLVEVNQANFAGPFLLQLCGFSVTHDCYNLSAAEDD